MLAGGKVVVLLVVVVVSKVVCGSAVVVVVVMSDSSTVTKQSKDLMYLSDEEFLQILYVAWKPRMFTLLSDWKWILIEMLVDVTE